jgi:hypothetical protein
MRRLKDQKSLDESLEEGLDGIGEGKRGKKKYSREYSPV